jgi:hypothetical protein
MWGSVKGLVIEPGENADLGLCPCGCGNMGRSVWGYVSSNNAARALYYARYIDKHQERGVQFLVSIGNWGDSGTAASRRTIAVECRMGDNGRPTFMVVDAATMPWSDEETMGKGLTRDQVMADPVKDEVFPMVDQVSFEDRRIKSFLCGS